MEFVRTDLRVSAIAPAAVNTPLLHNFEIADGVDVKLMKPYMGFRGMAEADGLARLLRVRRRLRRVPNMHGAVISVDNGITAADRSSSRVAERPGRRRRWEFTTVPAERVHPTGRAGSRRAASRSPRRASSVVGASRWSRRG